MAKYSKAALKKLSMQLDIDPNFFSVCLEESIVEVSEVKGFLHLANGTVFRLRRLQRLCITFEIDLPVALLLFHQRY